MGKTTGVQIDSFLPVVSSVRTLDMAQFNWLVILWQFTCDPFCDCLRSVGCDINTFIEWLTFVALDANLN